MPDATDTANGIEPFHVKISDSQIADLKYRLENASLPDPETVDDWSQGVPLAVVDEFRLRWLEDYDWRDVEAELNAIPQGLTEIDGLSIHFLHLRSSRSDAKPLLITHGWPGSVAEYLDILPGLTEPPEGEPAFHVVLPSVPGFGFAGKAGKPGWGIQRIAEVWVELMSRLGYERFCAQGGDWGAMITTTLALRHPDRLAMIHTPVPWAIKPEGFDDASLTDTEKQWLGELAQFRATGGGYAALMSTKPQNFGYGVVDSPVAQLAWVLEAHIGHGERDGEEKPLTPARRTLDNASLHWFTRSGASAARLYWESLGKMDMTTPVTVPTGVTVYPKEIMKLPRAWVEARYLDLCHWETVGTGGHYAMLEVPDLYAAQIRAALAHAPD